ncbi:hypothetical protein LCGC14_1065040 [marine sediment metagenome]|uniref:Uncharacterized protein n=1 Tax=marine sediment metagenome TaxID=412755 RepID=A0A0F9MPN1_9ZZZZ
MDANIEEVYAVFGELVAVQGVSLKRLQRQAADLDERLALALDRLKKFEEPDDIAEHRPNGHSGREVPLAEGDGQAERGLPRETSVSGNPSDAR